MVATKMVPNKRRGGFNNGMPGRPRFKPGGPKSANVRNMGAMFNANQLGDNPGFVDFNDDVQIPSTSTTTTAAAATNTTSAATKNGTAKGPARKANPNQKRVNVKNGAGMRRMPPGNMGGGHWGPPMPPMPPMFPMRGGRRNGPPPPPPHFRMHPMGMRGMRGGPMMPPPPPNGRFGGPPMGPGPMGMMPRPMPPMPPMRGPMMNPMGHMMPPPMRGPHMRRNPNGKIPPGRMGKGPKGAGPRGPPVNGKVVKPTVGKKIKPKAPGKSKEEYPLDKPWVTEEIKAEHAKKVELAERLKGNKDDALFAQFKEQRDKFVKMYDAARLEFIGKHPEQDVEKILTESVAANKAKANTESQKSNDAVSTDTPAATKSSTTTSATATANSVGAAKSAASSA